MTTLASLRTSIFAVAAFAAIATTATASPELEEVTAATESMTPQERRAAEHYKASLDAYYREKEAEAFKVRQMLAEQQRAPRDLLAQKQGVTIEQVEAELERRERLEALKAEQQRRDEAQAIERRQAEKRREIGFMIAAGVVALCILGLIGWVGHFLGTMAIAYRKTKLAEWEKRRERAYKCDLDDFGARS